MSEEKVIHEVKVVETEDGYRIEIKGDKERIKSLRFGPFGPMRHAMRNRMRRMRHHMRGYGPGCGPGYGPWGWGWDEEDEPEPEAPASGPEADV